MRLNGGKMNECKICQGTFSAEEVIEAIDESHAACYEYKEEMKNLAFPCLLCGAQLERMFDEKAQPSFGLNFITSGNYGSQVFDDWDGDFLTFNLCDKCVIEYANRELIKYQTNFVKVFVDGKPSGHKKIKPEYSKYTGHNQQDVEHLTFGQALYRYKNKDQRYGWNELLPDQFEEHISQQQQSI